MCVRSTKWFFFSFSALKMIKLNTVWSPPPPAAWQLYLLQADKESAAGGFYLSSAPHRRRIAPKAEGPKADWAERNPELFFTQEKRSKMNHCFVYQGWIKAILTNSDFVEDYFWDCPPPSWKAPGVFLCSAGPPKGNRRVLSTYGTRYKAWTYRLN